MTNIQSFGPESAPPPPRSPMGRRGVPRSPLFTAVAALPIGGYIVVPASEVKRATSTSVSMWGKREGKKYKTYRTAGDEGRGIAPGSLVIQRVS